MSGDPSGAQPPPTRLIHSLHRATEQSQAIEWTRGRGALLYDAHDREYLDALAGLWNVIVGHGRAELADAASSQMRQLAYASAYSGSTNRPAIELAQRLAAISYPNLNRFFFTSGGAEANEAAFKTARYYWRSLGHPEKHKIISREWGYHGTTLAAMSATGMPAYWKMFEPRVLGFSHIASPYPYRFDWAAHARPNETRTPGQIAADLLEAEILAQGPHTVAAFIGEPVQGAGGVIVPPDDYWPRIRQICDRYHLLLIADEVITGFGRTGPWFALTAYGVEPDLMTFAKGVTSGYFPFGGVAVHQKIARALDEAADDSIWMHAYTYSAHPTGCKVAIANLDLLETEGLLAQAAELGVQLRRGLATLASHKNVGDVRSSGLMAAVELVADKPTKAAFPAEKKIGHQVHLATQRRGMYTRLRGDVYNLAPCYVTTPTQLDRMVNILADSIEEVLGPG